MGDLHCIALSSHILAAGMGHCAPGLLVFVESIDGLGTFSSPILVCPHRGIVLGFRWLDLLTASATKPVPGFGGVGDQIIPSLGADTDLPFRFLGPVIRGTSSVAGICLVVCAHCFL